MDNPYRPPTSEVRLTSGASATEPVDEHIPASAGQRFVATCIDSLLVIPILVGMVFAMFFAFGEDGIDRIPDQLFSLGMSIPSAIGFGLIEGSSWQASPGKRLLKIQVVRIDGRPLVPSVAIKRNLAKYFGTSICGLLGLTVLRTPGSSLWDQAAKTRVVRAPQFRRTVP